MKRQDIIDEARRYASARVRWRHRGRSFQGVDCIGLVIQLADHFGVPYVDVDGYSRNPDGRFVDLLMKYLEYPRDQKLRHGGVVVLREQHHPCHVGILNQKAPGVFTLIHSSISRKMVVEEPYDKAWRERFRCVLDFPGVED